MRAAHLFAMDTEAQPPPWGLEPLIDVGELAEYLGIPAYRQERVDTVGRVIYVLPGPDVARALPRR